MTQCQWSNMRIRGGRRCRRRGGGTVVRLANASTTNQSRRLSTRSCCRCRCRCCCRRRRRRRDEALKAKTRANTRRGFQLEKSILHKHTRRRTQVVRGVHNVSARVIGDVVRTRGGGGADALFITFRVSPPPWHQQVRFCL